MTLTDGTRMQAGNMYVYKMAEVERKIKQSSIKFRIRASHFPLAEKTLLPPLLRVDSLLQRCACRAVA
jgi:hypothetical protein